MFYSTVEIHLGRLQENFRQLAAFFPRQTLAPVIKTAGRELALEIEEKGYDWIIQENS